MTGEAAGRVLVADDEPDVVDMLEEVLARAGYVVATALAGDEALAAVPGFRPDAILLDVSMPGLSGTEVVEALRRDGTRAAVVMISGRPDVRPGAGIFAVIEKPFEFTTVVRVVAEAVAVGRSGRG
jgi:CheY-like chemotaxis protein